MTTRTTSDILLEERDASAPPDTSTVVGKVVAILDSFAAGDLGLSLRDLELRTGLPKATLHRVAAALVSVKVLDRVGDSYRVGGHLLEIGMRASFESRLLETAMPYMEDLHARTQETIHFGIRDQREVVYFAKIPGRSMVGVPSRLGGAYAAALHRHRQGTSRALLS